MTLETLKTPPPLPPGLQFLPTTLIQAVSARLESKLEGYRVRYVTQPATGVGIKQVYRVENYRAWPVEMDAAGLELANRVADDLADQIVKYANRAIGQELISWDGEISHTVDAGDRANGAHCSVRVQRHVGRGATSVRFDVIFRVKDLPRTKA
jgi:hypothetical protein